MKKIAIRKSMRLYCEDNIVSDIEEFVLGNFTIFDKIMWTEPVTTVNSFIMFMKKLKKVAYFLLLII